MATSLVIGIASDINFRVALQYLYCCNLKFCYFLSHRPALVIRLLLGNHQKIITFIADRKSYAHCKKGVITRREKIAESARK